MSAKTGRTVGVTQYPPTEMGMEAVHADWAEQHPEDWWIALGHATRQLLQQTHVSPALITGIGIAYQMHGLVLVDKKGEVLRPAIIWCDSRAVTIGNNALAAIGMDYCLAHYLNAPGNFTASKLRWVRENEPAVFASIHKMMLPGDYIAYRMTNQIYSTITGLSEGILWDFANNDIAHKLLEQYEIPESMLPEIVPVFSEQGKLTPEAAAHLGLAAGIPINYRSGDQPNNALSLNVLRPGEVAATGGTSGVVYAVTDQPRFDPQLRVNSFAHVNYTPEKPLTGVLLCINGAGIQYSWVRSNIGGNELTYSEMEQVAAKIAIGSDGLQILPFGNGAERMLGNRTIGSRIMGLNFNHHQKAHFYRAALEGIAFSFVYGMEAMQEMGIPTHVVRVGNDNLFQSEIFSSTIATLMDTEIEVMDTTGAIGAAKAAGVATGIYATIEEAMQRVEIVHTHQALSQRGRHLEAYNAWKTALDQALITT